VGAEDVGSGEDRGYVGGGRGVEAVFHGWCSAVEKDRRRGVLSESVGEEAFARGSGEERQVESAELVEVCQQGVVFVELLAEAEAGIEDDLVAWDAGSGGGIEACCEFGED